jgi:putative transposase
VAQDFTADGPDRKWGADISYIWTAEGWLYLAVVLDLFSRRVVGWATSDRLKRDLAVEALRRALVARNPAPGLVHHSDRGSQYCSVDYQALLRKRGILISMSGRGNCYDNSMVETFFKTIKSELIWPVGGNPASRPKTPSPDTSTGSITPSGGIHRSASKAPSPSSERPGK